jgi:hypothetical protein
MASWQHDGGFSLDARVRNEGADRPGLERLLRYCARPAFALERWREIDAEHVASENNKPGPGSGISLMLTALERIERLAALMQCRTPSPLWANRAPPPWEMQGATLGENAPQAQSVPEHEVDQRIAWQRCSGACRRTSAKRQARRAAIARRERTRVFAHPPGRSVPADGRRP